jgi:putative transposase
MIKSTPLVPGCYYHIYNRGNNRENIFHEQKNYYYFIKLYTKHILPVADTYAYCLMKNHFHFLIQIKEDLSGLENLTGLSQPFSNFFNAYARAFNRAYGRTGALFQRPFGRIRVTNDVHFIRLITYIHQNPQKHGFVDDFREWPYSSYHVLLSDKPVFLQRDRVLAMFQGRRQLEASHQIIFAGQELSALAPEDFD